MSADPQSQYLQRYAEADIQALDTLTFTATFEHCLVIPCLRETPAFAERLLNGTLSTKKVLVIVMINQSTETIEPLNQQLIAYFDKFEPIWQHDHLKLCHNPISATHWLIVDRTQPPYLIPPKQGVGLARKIGCDLAVALAAKGVLNSRWIHSTDADAHLPANYFDMPTEVFSAAVYDFTHIRAGASIAEWRATQLYEQALHYYVAGLRWAGSPYAHHTIGSVLAFSIQAYCQARGFPKRNAGEDFYLLNKLTKLGPVAKLPAKVELEARTSDRVPFGTGPAVKTIAAMSDPESEYCYYAPAVFVGLKLWLDSIPALWTLLQTKADPLANLPQVIRTALLEAGIDALWTHLDLQFKDAQACERAVHTWFDGFQTLKLIRRLQDVAYPPRPLQECLRDAPFCNPATRTSSISADGQEHLLK